MKFKVDEFKVEGQSPSGDWVVTRDSVNKDTGEVKEGGGQNSYHGKLHQACLSILNHNLTKAAADDLKAVVKTVREEATKIKEVCDRIEELFKQALEQNRDD